MLGLGIGLNGDYSNTEYNLPSNPWSSGFMQMDTWRMLGVSTPVMTEDITSIDFRFWGDSESSHPDVWYIDNIVITRPEWDLTLPSLAEAYRPIKWMPILPQCINFITMSSRRKTV
jgi:hypothetical protein